jgi:hypothetical protein
VTYLDTDATVAGVVLKRDLSAPNPVSVRVARPGGRDLIGP